MSGAMSPSDLAEYVAAVGMTLSGIFWFNVIIAGFFGFFDKERK